MYGLANIILSSLSNIPPWPGIILPLSFTLDSLFNFDSIKSPNVPKTLTIIAIISQFGVVNVSSIYLETIDAEIQQNKRPHKNPSTVLWGDIL